MSHTLFLVDAGEKRLEQFEVWEPETTIEDEAKPAMKHSALQCPRSPAPERVTAGIRHHLRAMRLGLLSSDEIVDQLLATAATLMCCSSGIVSASFAAFSGAAP